MGRITPFIWFESGAEEAAAFYTGLIPDSGIVSTSYYPPDSPGKAGEVMSVELALDGQRLVIINGGPVFRLSEAFSFMIEANTQHEIDRYWEALTADGGTEGQCGWLTDRFGLTWQVAPAQLNEWLADSDREAATRTFTAMSPMTKLDLEALRAAHAGA